MKKTVWTFGLIAGGILSAMMLITIPFAHSMAYDKSLVIGYTTMVLAFLLTFFGVRSYRENVGGGTVSFGRALAVGTLISLIASVCYVATWELLYFKLAPDYAANMESFMVDHAKSSGGSPEEIQKKVADAQTMARRLQNPAFNAAMTFVEPLPVGLVFALVSAGVLSRKRRGATARAAVPVV